MVKQVPIEFIHHVWAQVSPMLERAMEHSKGEYNLDQLKGMLILGTQVLIVNADGDEIKGAATICFENYPNARIAFITSVGGTMVANKEVWDGFCEWAKAMGCTKMRGFAFESVARLWKRSLGIETVYLVVEKTL